MKKKQKIKNYTYILSTNTNSHTTHAVKYIPYNLTINIKIKKSYGTKMKYFVNTDKDTYLDLTSTYLQILSPVLPTFKNTK